MSEAGERGPKGDHGQAGDEGSEGRVGETGVQGETGLAGLPGERGKVGDTGQAGPAGAEGGEGKTGGRGRRGPSNWLSYLIAAIALFAAAWIFIEDDQRDDRDVARTTIQNCEQIEVVKEQLRGTVQASLDRLPKLAYYKEHPDELKQAIVDAKKSVARFAPIDCYHLPAARDAGITPANANGSD